MSARRSAYDRTLRVRLDREWLADPHRLRQLLERHYRTPHNGFERRWDDAALSRVVELRFSGKTLKAIGAELGGLSANRISQVLWLAGMLRHARQAHPELAARLRESYRRDVIRLRLKPFPPYRPYRWKKDRPAPPPWRFAEPPCLPDPPPPTHTLCTACHTFLAPIERGTCGACYALSVFGPLPGVTPLE